MIRNDAQRILDYVGAKVAYEVEALRNELHSGGGDADSVSNETRKAMETARARLTGE